MVPAALLDVAELEHHATHLRTIQITHIPGVFQTEDYTRTVFGYAIPPLPENELEARVAQRLERSGVLYRDAAPPYEALIHEAALRMRFGGGKVARAQLEHIQELSHLPHISVRVIPFAADGHIGPATRCSTRAAPVRPLDTVQIDSATASASCTRRRTWPTTASCTTPSRRWHWTSPVT